MAKHRTRKGLNNVLHGDRADIRAAHHHSTGGQQMKLPWDNSHKSATTSKSYSNYGSSYGGQHKSCYHTHPALVMPGTEFKVYGGNSDRPIVEDADVYIGFQSGMPVRPVMPWENPPEQVYFFVADMQVPVDVEKYKLLVQWTKDQVDAGLKVHAGCIGGHGRTGMFLSALVSLYGEVDAISYVRKHYCTKAVESKVQVEFLHQHFGITKVAGAKEHIGSSVTKVVNNPNIILGTFGGKPFQHLSNQGSIWGVR